MTLRRPEELKPDARLQDRARNALDHCRSYVALVGVREIVRFLRRALNLAVHPELVYTWRQAGLPVVLIHQHGSAGGGAPHTWVSNAAQTLRWLREHGSSSDGRLREVRSSQSRVSSNRHNAGPKESSITQVGGTKAHPRQNNNPMRGPKAKGRKGQKGPVHEV